MDSRRLTIRVVCSLLFFCNGCAFLLVSFVYWPDIVKALTSMEEGVGWTPPLWDLLLVLKIARVIFAIVGIFLVLFAAIVFFWPKRR